MYGQLRVARSRALRSLPQKRYLATPPTTPPPVTGLPPNAPASLNTVPIRPVVVTATPTPTPGSSTLVSAKPLPSSSLPPPPPPSGGPKKPRKLFRKFIIYTSLGAITFYLGSGLISTYSEGYREFFVANFPGGETIADFADDNNWKSLGFGSSLQKKAIQSYNTATGKLEESNTQKLERKASETKSEIVSLGEKAKAKGVEVKDKITGKETTSEKIQHKAQDLKDKALAATHNAEDRLKHLAHDAKEKVDQVTKDIPFNFSDGVEGIVREAEKAVGKTEQKSKNLVNKAESSLKQAEKKAEDAFYSAEKKTENALQSAEIKAANALHSAEDKLENAAHDVKEALTPHATEYEKAVSPYQQRTRELNTNVIPQKPSFEGKRIYDGPPLPLGHEPPPGYYIPPPVKPIVQSAEEEKVEKVIQTLPLLVPKVKEFATSEPIISQLASTIDSLTTSLSTSSSTGLPSTDATSILSTAQADLTALNKRLQDVKNIEKENLEKQVNEKTKEFETLLKGKEADWVKSEQGLKDEWSKERESLVEKWRHELEGELESQRQGIEQRLRDEVVSQGIELQRRWLRSIKTQVETERGGRLAKLDNLTTSLKQLERVTLDNSAELDDNVRLHKIWSALRAVQTKVDLGDVTFSSELNALKSLSNQEKGETIISTTLAQLEKSGIPNTGVKSLSSLSLWFTTSIAPKVHSSSLVPAPEDASVLSHLASLGLSKLLFRPSPGKVDGQNVGSVLARAEYCLSQKDLDGAAREINTLKGWPGKLANDWLVEARRKLEVQQALEIVATEATLSSLLLV